MLRVACVARDSGAAQRSSLKGGRAGVWLWAPAGQVGPRASRPSGGMQGGIVQVEWLWKSR